jgi:hypothetical protein
LLFVLSVVVSVVIVTVIVVTIISSAARTRANNPVFAAFVASHKAS